ncbi:MAG TPA: YtxH domain-containing protein, partial [Acidobacteriaceae bacterium]|nr:YtxH domain-containing protein [Acidobacteriaceae bacterium]
METLKFWAAFGIGVAAGAAVALVYAPQSGAKTRKQLKRNLEDASEYIQETADTLGKHAERSVRVGKDAVETVKSKAEWV